MKVLCFGKSETRQKARSEFFMGAGCVAEWTTDLQTAINMLGQGRFDAIVVGATVLPPDTERIRSHIKQLNLHARVFTITTPTPFDEPDLVPALPAILFRLQGLSFGQSA